ncbi:AMP-dependent synthetase/ligase [Streptomyces gobiensis]|uniref:AMP-dependent synthetase/ligase n=1 Tax=Streptomyces gobiensis TaxID=2875706 RepID=UPI001E3D9278|nr:long-chain fatty acid--CoA ligase [Streptomyces gobiensis]UGY92957.1 long-chain fatty acid--CoA ligase [Streptomyces gobiensis]
MSAEPARPGTLALFAEWSAEQHGPQPALRFRTADGDGWETVTYTEFRDTVRAIARGLMGLGVRRGDRVAVLAETRPEWTYAHLAVLAAGAVVVPVYPTAGEEEVTWVLGDSAASVILCEDAAQRERVERVRGKLPALRAVVPMDTMGELAAQAPLDELLARSGSVEPGDLCSIIYTSGTTGMPKGCRITHGNIVSVHDSTVDFIEGGPGSVTYLYLPLAHAMAQLIELRCLVQGGELCFFGGVIENIVAELAEVKPTHLPSVPRLFEKVHATVLSIAESQEGGRERFDAAVRLGVQAADLRAQDKELPEELREPYAAADEKLYGLVRAIFGGRLRWALTGAAPIAPQTLDFLRACGIEIFEGYGMTESGGVIALNHAGAVRYGTVGKPIPGCEVRIAEDGEVLARGANVFPGYHANEAATAQTLDPEGWLHTGDLGSLDEDGYLTITGRKKDLIITSAGKNLTPSQVELAIQQSRYVSRAVMVGDKRPYPVALITLDPDTTKGLPEDEIRRLVEAAVEAANAQVARPARIRAFTILDGDFTVETGVLTPTMKVRRKAVMDRYAAEIEALYAPPG